MSYRPVFDKSEWVVVASGPSAPDWVPFVCTNSRRIACVNGSVNLLPAGRLPDTYAVFEGAAYGEYKATFKELQRLGVFTMARNIVRKMGGHPDEVVDVGWGSDCGYDKDKLVREHEHIMVTGGVELLHAIAYKFRPPAIHLVGFDGYSTDKLHAEKAGQTEPRSAKWCKQVNEAMSLHLGAIMRAFEKIRFVVYGKPIHAAPSWRCTFITEKDNG